MILSDVLVQWKVRLAVAGAMLSLVGMPYLVAVQVQEQLLKVGVVLPFWVIILSGLFILLLVGYVYDKSGLFEREQGYLFLRNNQWQQFMEKENEKRK